MKVVIRRRDPATELLLAAFRSGEQTDHNGQACLVHGYRDVGCDELEWELFLIGVKRCMQTGEHTAAPIELTKLGDPWRTIACAWCGEIVEERRWDPDPQRSGLT